MMPEDFESWWGANCPRFDPITTGHVLAAWQAGKPKWADVRSNPPAYGKPVILKIDGVVQQVTYMRDGADGCDDWFEPYHYEDKEHGVFVGGVESLEWMPLPEVTTDDQ